MAETWQPGSTCRLVNVPWDAEYERVVNFETADARDEYFKNLTSVINLEIREQTYIRPNAPLVVDAPYSYCYRANYIVVENPVQPVENSKPEHLFYFIVDTQYASPASTRLVLQLDVWQTRFVESGTLYTGYLERGHFPRWVAYNNLINQSGKYSMSATLRRWCSAPEGLDIGTSYHERTTQVVQLQTWDDTSKSPKGGFVFVILATADLTADPGSIESPSLRTATSSYGDDILMPGFTCVIDDPEDMQKLMSAASEYTWVTQNIIGIYAVPKQLFDFNNADNKVQLFGGNIGVEAYTTYESRDYGNSFTIATDAINFNRDIWGYDNFGPANAKMMASPYTYFALTSHQGNELLLKPELLAYDHNNIRCVDTICPPYIRAGLYIDMYGWDTVADESYQYTFQYDGTPTDVTADAKAGTWIDDALWISDFPQLPIVNNNYVSYMASTANTRQYQYDSASWSRTASNAATQNSYEQTQRGLATQSANMQIQNEVTDQNRMLGLVGSAMSAGTQLLGGNIIGGLSTAANALIQTNQSVNSQNAANAQFSNNQALTSANADANRRLSEYVTQGNYENTIKGIQAQCQDAQLKSPSLSGQFGGGGFAMAHGLYSVMVKVKTLPSGPRAQVQKFFDRYGYALNEYMVLPRDRANLNLMSEYTYWKIQDITLDCDSANETEKQAIRGIFSKGVTVYDGTTFLTNQTMANAPKKADRWEELFECDYDFWRYIA